MSDPEDTSAAMPKLVKSKSQPKPTQVQLIKVGSKLTLTRKLVIVKTLMHINVVK